MSKTNKSASPKYVKPVFAALLSALIFLLTFFVVILVGPLTITLNCLPVAIGAVLLGGFDVGSRPGKPEKSHRLLSLLLNYGVVLGAVFGVSSFLKTVTGGGGPLMTMLLGINPFLTFVMCFVPRVICGWVPGLLFRLLPKNTEPKWLVSSAVCCGLTTLLNTVGFLGCMWLFFRGSLTGKPTDNLFVFIFTIAGVNALVEFAINLVFGTAVCRAMYAVTKNKI